MFLFPRPVSGPLGHWVWCCVGLAAACEWCIGRAAPATTWTVPEPVSLCLKGAALHCALCLAALAAYPSDTHPAQVCPVLGAGCPVLLLLLLLLLVRAFSFPPPPWFPPPTSPPFSLLHLPKPRHSSLVTASSLSFPASVLFPFLQSLSCLFQANSVSVTHFGTITFLRLNPRLSKPTTLRSYFDVPLQPILVPRSPHQLLSEKDTPYQEATLFDSFHETLPIYLTSLLPRLCPIVAPSLDQDSSFTVSKRPSATFAAYSTASSSRTNRPANFLSLCH